MNQSRQAADVSLAALSIGGKNSNADEANDSELNALLAEAAEIMNNPDKVLSIDFQAETESSLSAVAA